LAHGSKIATGYRCYASVPRDKKSGGTKDEESVMKCSNPIVVMNDKAVDITIYILGGISIVLSLAMGLSLLLYF
jgi:hypothetical protein